MVFVNKQSNSFIVIICNRERVSPSAGGSGEGSDDLSHDSAAPDAAIPSPNLSSNYEHHPKKYSADMLPHALSPRVRFRVSC